MPEERKLTRENKETHYSAEKIEVFVMFMKQYLYIFWDHLDKAKDLFKALEFAAAIPSEDRTKDYFEYYKQEALESGLKSGKFISGRLNVNKHLAHFHLLFEEVHMKVSVRRMTQMS